MAPRSLCRGVPAGFPRYQTETMGSAAEARAGNSIASAAVMTTAAHTIRRSIDNASLGAKRFTDLLQMMNAVTGHLRDEVVDRQRAVFGMRDDGGAVGG